MAAGEIKLSVPSEEELDGRSVRGRTRARTWVKPAQRFETCRTSSCESQGTQRSADRHDSIARRVVLEADNVRRKFWGLDSRSCRVAVVHSARKRVGLERVDVAVCHVEAEPDRSRSGNIPEILTGRNAARADRSEEGRIWSWRRSGRWSDRV